MIENQGKQKHFEQSTEPKRKQNYNTKKLIEKEKKTVYKKRCGICTYSYNIYSDSTTDIIDLFTLFLP